MKRYIIIAALVLIGLSSCVNQLKAEPPLWRPAAAFSFQLFYDDLSPYGTWVSYPSYGYVWVPSMGAGFVPYSTGGHWEFSEYGWTWVSDYAWGWGPYHYGRW